MLRLMTVAVLLSSSAVAAPRRAPAGLRPPPLVRTEPPPPLVTAPPPSDAEFCTQMTEVSRRVLADLPKQVDPITTTTGFSVLCSLRTVTVTQSLSISEAEFREDWREREQKKWNQTICGGNGVFQGMARRGWRFTQRLTFATGTLHMTDADCSSE